METYRGGSTNQGLRRLLRKYAEGGSFPEPALRDEDTYGPDTGQYRTDRAQATSDVVKAALAKSNAAMAARPMEPDLMGYQTGQAPEGYWYDDAGFMRNPQGQEVTPERRPSIIPFDKYGDFTNSKLLDLAGNLSGGILAPVRGAQGAFLLGSGPVRKAVEVAAQQVPRELSPLGFYSHGAETAANLAQAKGTPQQFRGMLEKYGVKPVELEGFDEAFANRPSVTREELAAHFNERRPQIEETVLDGRGKLEMDDAAKQKWIEDSAAERAYNSGDLDEIRDWRNASDDIRTWHLDAARYDFNEEMAVNPDFASQFQTIRENDAAKFQKYTLPGGENYREVLLKLPSDAKAPTFEQWYEKTHIKPLESYADNPRMMEMFRNKYDAEVKNMPKEVSFKDPHWDDPNVIAHLRFSDRIGPNGEKILHVEEAQSGWGQKGRKEGFKIPLTPELENSANAIIENKLQPGAEFMNPSWRTKEGKVDPRAVTPSYVEFLEKNGTISPDEAKTLQSWNKARGFDASGVPTAPYVTNTAAWTDLAIKRALREAAEGGYDRLVWTPGAEQAKRYDLSKQISRLVLENDPAGGHKLRAYSPSGNQVINKRIVDADRELPDLIGKDVAKKLLDQDLVNPKVFSEKLTSNDIIVVPEEGRYQISTPWGWSTHVGMGVVNSPEAAAEYGAKHFSNLAKTVNSNMGTSHATEYKNATRSLIGQDLSVGGEGMKGYYDKIYPNQLSKQVKKLDPSAKVGITDVMLPQGKHGMMGHNNPPFAAPGVTITPKMRDAIMKGQTEFARGGSVQGYATGGPTDNSLEALYNKYAGPTMRQRTRARYAEGGPVSSAAIYDPAEIDALAASIIEGNYA